MVVTSCAKISHTIYARKRGCNKQALRQPRHGMQEMPTGETPTEIDSQIIEMLTMDHNPTTLHDVICFGHKSLFIHHTRTTCFRLTFCAPASDDDDYNDGEPFFVRLHDDNQYKWAREAERVTVIWGEA